MTHLIKNNPKEAGIGILSPTTEFKFRFFQGITVKMACVNEHLIKKEKIAHVNTTLPLHPNPEEIKKPSIIAVSESKKHLQYR